MRNLVRTLLAALLLAAAAPLAVPTPASAQSPQSNCPTMTDSITRLYLAYFGREPDPSGLSATVSEITITKPTK